MADHDVTPSSAVPTHPARGLILDFGGVVTTDFYGALQAFCRGSGLAPHALANALKHTERGRGALSLAETGAISQCEFELVVAELLDVDAEGLFGRVLADLQPRVEIIELVAQARAAGVRTAVLSNSWGVGDVDPYAGYDLQARFDTVVISDQVGLRKPDPAIYELTAAGLGLPPHACAFVDDTAHNLPPAALLGMSTVLFDEGPTGIAQIKKLLDL